MQTTTNRRQFLGSLAAGATTIPQWAALASQEPPSTGRTTRKRRIPVALVQCSSVAGQVNQNLDKMESLAEEAAKAGAQWIQFHELTVCDYVDDPGRIAELVPQGTSTTRMVDVAKRLRTIIIFGLAERERGRRFDTAVFVGPQGYLHRYRKTWLWYERKDQDYRDEWARYDPGTGPELFQIEGLRATCFICSDSNSKRCAQRAAALKPQIVFFPINRHTVSSFEDYGSIAKKIGAPMLVTNRVGWSWNKETLGGSVVYSANGEILARANMEGREEILHYNLELPA